MKFFHLFQESQFLSIESSLNDKSGMSVRPEDGTEKDIYGQTLIISAFLKNNFNGVGRLYCDKGAKMRKKGDINPAVDKFHRELGIQAPKMRF